MLLQLSEFRRHKNSSSLRWRGRRTKTDSAPPSGVLRDLLLCHLGSAHADAKQKRITTIIIDWHHQSPVIIHIPPSRPQTQPASSSIARDTFHFLSIALHTSLSASNPASSREPLNLSNLNQNHHNFPVQSSLRLNTLQSLFAPRHPIWRHQSDIA